MFHVLVVVRNPKHEHLGSVPIDAIVDAGAELSWLPRELLAGIGIVPRRKRAFRTAAGHVVTRDIGYGIVCAEGFGVVVDNVAHRLVPRPFYAVVAGWRPSWVGRSVASSAVDRPPARGREARAAPRARASRGSAAGNPLSIVRSQQSR